MKFLNGITKHIKTIATVAVVLGAFVAACNAFTAYWEQNFKNNQVDETNLN